jgi:hypothetical protein
MACILKLTTTGSFVFTEVNFFCPEKNKKIKNNI